MTRKALAILVVLTACMTSLSSTAGAATSSQIIKDCAGDSVLQGTYTIGELRKARAALDGDTKEYTDCDSVLRRAITALQQADARRAATPGATPVPTQAGAPGTPAGEPSGYDAPTDFDKDRLKAAADSGEEAVPIGGVKLVPAAGVRVDSSPLPSPLLIALVVLAVTGLAAALLGRRPDLTRLRRR